MCLNFCGATHQLQCLHGFHLQTPLSHLHLDFQSSLELFCRHASLHQRDRAWSWNTIQVSTEVSQSLPLNTGGSSAIWMNSFFFTFNNSSTVISATIFPTTNSMATRTKDGGGGNTTQTEQGHRRRPRKVTFTQIETKTLDNPR